MFTRDELRAIPLFSEVPDKELDYLARTSADIRLLSGEYVVHEGETRRVLFVLVEGRVEVTKFVDGAERVVGFRGPGEVFGEVPVVLDTPFLVSFRAAQQSRVMLIEAKDFHTLAASAPKVSAAVGAAALDRVGGLQEIAAAPSQPLLAVIGPQWDNTTHELREFCSATPLSSIGSLPKTRRRHRFRSIRSLTADIQLCGCGTACCSATLRFGISPKQ